MKKFSVLFFAVILAALAVGLVIGLALARSETLINAVTAPTVVSYQGEVFVANQPYTGTGYFKFAVVNSAGNYTYWSNDGSSASGSEPVDAVPLSVQDGLFSVLLGNTNLTNMTQPLEAGVFADRGRRLHVWFDQDAVGPYTDLGLTTIAAVPYALNAETLDGKDGNYYDQHYAHVIVVAKSGGDFTSIQAAIDSVGDASQDEPYLVWVGPGTFTESVRMKPYVHLQGAGQEVTLITSDIGSDAYNAINGTMELTRNVSLREISLINVGSHTSNTALFAPDGVTETLIANVTARATGAGDYNSGMALTGHDSSLILEDCTAIAEYGNVSSVGLKTTYSEIVIRGGLFKGNGQGQGIGLMAGSSILEARGIKAVGEADEANYGIYISAASHALVFDSTLIGSGGASAYGIYNTQNSILELEGCTVRAEDAATSYGLDNYYENPVITVTHSLLSGDTSPSRSRSAGHVTLLHTILISDMPITNTGSGTTLCVAVSRGASFSAGPDCP